MALLPPSFLDSAVAIGFRDRKDSTRWLASGFLYGDFIEKVDEETNKYLVYLVTNRHVFEDARTAYLRFNPMKGRQAREYTLQLISDKGGQLWQPHPDPEIDIAVIRVYAPKLREDGIQFSYYRSNLDVARLSDLREKGISEGDHAFVLGFPMGLVGGERNFVIVRHASIARIRDAFGGEGKEILLDCFVFPGNSGGPVVLKPELASVMETKPVQSADLIGVVTSYVPYRDVAVSTQTQRPRVIFEENSGLASVVPIDFVEEAIKLYCKPVPQVEAPPGDSRKES